MSLRSGGRIALRRPPSYVCRSAFLRAVPAPPLRARVRSRSCWASHSLPAGPPGAVRLRTRVKSSQERARRLPEVWPPSPYSLFPSGVTSVFRVFPTGLSTPLFSGYLFVFRLLPPPSSSLTLAGPAFSCVAPPRPPSPGIRSQSGAGAGPTHSARALTPLAREKARTERAGPSLLRLWSSWAGGAGRSSCLAFPEDTCELGGFGEESNSVGLGGGRGAGSFFGNCSVLRGRFRHNLCEIPDVWAVPRLRYFLKNLRNS